MTLPRNHRLVLLILPMLLLAGCQKSSSEESVASETAKKNETFPKALNINEVAKKVEFPADLREEGVSGKVVYRLQIDENGRYAQHKLIQAADERLAEAVTKHLDELRFEPGTENGHPVKKWITVPFNFRLPEQDK